MKAMIKARAAFRLAWRTLRLLLHGLFRGLGLAVIFLVLLGATAYFVLGSMFNQERAKSVVIDKMQEVFRRPVQIDGMVFSPHGIKVRGVRVFSNAKNEPHLLEGEFALITVKLLPLLHRRVELGNVKLVAPLIHLIRDEAGQWNVSDLFISTRAAASQGPAGPFSMPFSLAADRTVIERGVLTVEDRLRQTKIVVNKFDLTVKEFDVKHPFAISVAFNNVNTFGPTKVASSWAFDGAMSLSSFDWSQATLNAEKLRVSIDGSVIRGSVVVRGFPRAEIDAALRLPPIGPAELARYFPKQPAVAIPASRWRLKMSFPEPKKFRLDRVQVEAEPLAAVASGLVDLSGTEPTLSADLSLSAFPLQEAARFFPAWERYRLGGTAQGNVSISGWYGRLAIHRGEIGARGLKGFFKGQKILNADVSVSASDDFARVTASVSRGAVAAWANSFSDIALSLKLKNKDLNVDNLSMGWAGGKLKLKARVLNLEDPKQVMLSGTLDRLRWEDAQRLIEEAAAQAAQRQAAAAAKAAQSAPEAKKKPWLRTFKYAIPKKFPDTLGHIVIRKITQKNFDCDNLDLLWDIRGVSPSLKRLSGELKVGFGPGRVGDIPAVQTSHHLLRVIFLPFIFMHKMNNLSVLSAKTAYPKTLDFNRIEAEYGLKSGVATTRYFYVDSPQLVVYSDGVADFGQETVDMNILTRLTKYRGQLPEWWVDELGRPAIGFRVKGDMNDPVLEPRLRKMGADEIEKDMQDGMRRSKAEFLAEEKLRALQ